jgi:hypothetical protein
MTPENLAKMRSMGIKLPTSSSSDTSLAAATDATAATSAVGADASSSGAEAYVQSVEQDEQVQVQAVTKKS